MKQCKDVWVEKTFHDMKEIKEFCKKNNLTLHIRKNKTKDKKDLTE